jgi:signal transduction histidine kinase
MSPSIKTMIWIAFALFAIFVAIGAGLTTAVLQIEKNHEYRVLEESRPMLDAVRTMQSRLELMISAARAYSLTPQTQFTEQYEVAAREFQEAFVGAAQLAADPRNQRDLQEYGRFFEEVKRLTDRQMFLSKEGDGPHALEVSLEVSRIRGSTPDYAKMIIDRRRQADARGLQSLNDFRQWVMVSTILLGFAIIAAAAVAALRIEQSLGASIAREVRRTETMIAGMADGVMLVDHEGRTQFINPAGQKLLGRSDIGIPIFKHAEVYRLRNAAGRLIDEKELPVAQALATGRPAKDCLVAIESPDRRVTALMTATPLKEEGRITGVVVTFRDITERRRLEEEMQRQAERAQILAEAGAFFSSNIDPEWVTQAIAERVAEVLGDWAAVVLKAGETELRVASIYHRDMASLGLAWSYIYRQPLMVGEGIIGQVVATGYPSLTTNVGASAIQQDVTSYHPPSVSLASLLVLPLRTRRETLGALLIAANDPERVISDETLPLAELLAERAAVAIENAKLYTEQVEARRKVEDLSRLKDEFLSIASHELRTPVTSIKGYTQLAKTLIRENDLSTSEEYLDIALDQIDRMSRLILELLDVSRIETGRLEIRREPIQWTAFVSDVVHRHHTAVSERRFHVSMPVHGRFVNGDRDRLEQVLGNLLENAVKYSPDGSEITVGVEERGEDIVTSVSDRGIGIPPDELTQVFERFHRGRKVSSTNYGGLGLGLYITRQIIERHGGSIWVESVEGVGTTFSFSLPTVAVAQASQTHAAAHA